MPSRASARADAGGGAFAGAAAGRLGLAGVHEGLQERAGGEHDGAGAVDGVAADADADDAAVELGSPIADASTRSSIEQVFDHLLPQRQVRLLLDDPLDLGLIQLSCRPGPAGCASPGPCGG